MAWQVSSSANRINTLPRQTFPISNLPNTPQCPHFLLTSRARDLTGRINSLLVALADLGSRDARLISLGLLACCAV